MRIAEMIVLLATGCCFLLQPQTATVAIGTGLQVCATAILPSLFPFFVLTDYWITRGHARALSRSAEPLMKHLFHLPGSSASAFLLGSIGGYPVGARTVAQLYTQKLLSREQAEQALLFCNNAGPAFVLGVLGGGLFQSTFAGVILYLIHLLSAVLTGVLLRPKSVPTDSHTFPAQKQGPSISQCWTQAISGGGKTALQVCIFVLFFSVVTECIQGFLPVQPYTFLLTASLELAGGARLLGQSSLPATLQFSVSALILGWGGLCVMMQSLSVLQSAGLSGKKLLIGKLSQGIISFLLATIAAPLLPLSQNCFGFQSVSSCFPQQFALILLIGLFLKESTGNTEKNRI